FFSPLPDISHQVHYTERARAVGMRIDCIRATHGAALVGSRNSFSLPWVSPGIGPAIGTVRGVLPFPFMRKALPRPCRVSTSIFDRNPRNWFVVPTIRIFSVLPVTQEIQFVLWTIVRRVHELFELRIGHRILVNPE